MSEDVETLLKAWTTAFSEEVLDYAQPPEVRDEEVSYILYHETKLETSVFIQSVLLLELDLA